METVKDSIRVVGRVWARIKRADGKIEIIDGGNNLLVNDGCELLTDIMAETVGAFTPKCIAIGAGVAAPAVGDSDLQTAFAPEAGSFQACTKNVIAAGRTLQCHASFATPPAPWAVRECVLTDTDAAKGARKIFCRSTDLSFTLGVADTVTVFWEIEFKPNL